MKNVGIFCGGFSSEFAISVKSATTIYNHLNRQKYNPYLVLVKREGWFVLNHEQEIPLSPIDFSFEVYGQSLKLDIMHVYIHGNPGENGQLQAYFEMKGVPFVNSNALTSALSFDKWFCNQFLKSFGVKVADSVLLKHVSDANADDIITKLNLPVFVKPADSGSSYGISKVHTKEELMPAIENAFAEGKTVVIEAFMKGTEVTCGVYRSKNGVVALPCTEIVTDRDFFDYDAKYLGQSQEITPARISVTATQKVQQLTKHIYEILQLRSVARIDFMLVNDEPHVIEVNTTPGFSDASIVPKMLQTAGIGIAEFWEEVYEVEVS
jgi:D-alanine-D-alanine ligase